jgi:IS30 family transposase
MGHPAPIQPKIVKCVTAQSKQENVFQRKNIEEDHSGLVCSNVMGRFEVPSNSGFKYIVTFIIKKTRHVTEYPVRTKAEVGVKFEEYVMLISAKSSFVVKQLRSDNGGEYRNNKMSGLCERLKISQEFTVPYNPDQSGLAERFNRTLSEMVRCMLKDSQMDNKYWAEAFKTVAYVRYMINNPVEPGNVPM